MMQLSTQDGGKENKKYSILSGATFGSSFVGMVHVLNTTNTQVSDSLSSFKSSSAMMVKAGWFENSSGGMGVNASMANNVKNLLSSQNITSHVTLITTGVIPSVVANDVQMGVQQFTKFDPASSIEAVTSIQNATSADQDSMKQVSPTYSHSA